MEEIGYDAQDRLYFVLDDNRLYRRTDPAIPSPPPAKPKANSKRGRAAARAAKRRKVIEDDEDEDGDVSQMNEQSEVIASKEDDDPLGGRKWQCIAVTLPEYRDFLSTLKTRHPDEKYLHQHITDEVLPVIGKAEESQLRKQQKMEREMLTLQKLATAKRSSRLAGKQEREQAERVAVETEKKRQADLEAAIRDQERQNNMAQQRESRMMTREQRLKDREFKRILHEEELKRLAEDENKIDAGEARLSERHLKAEMAKRKKELQKLQQEDDWTFDCSICGVYGENLVSHTRSIRHSITDLDHRTTDPIASRVKSATSGSIRPVWESPSSPPSLPISTLSAGTAKRRQKRLPDRNQPPSNSSCQDRHHRRLDRRNTPSTSAFPRKGRALMVPDICHP